MTNPPVEQLEHADEVLALIRDFTAEVKSRRNPPQPTLGSSLERDLGIDSLARVELLLRLERRFKATLPERGVAGAETVSDLVRALGQAKAKEAGRELSGAAPPIELERFEGTPDRAATLVDVLEWHVRRHPDRPHITLYSEGDEREQITYGELLRRAEAVAGGLRETGLPAGQPVALMLPTCSEYFGAFFGILIAGGIPVPLYPPHRLNRLEEHVRRQARILKNAEVSLLIAAKEVKPLGGVIRSLAPGLQRVATVEELAAGARLTDRPVLKTDTTAFLQYTSGSTGDPKGVILTHANLLSNIRSMVSVVQAEPSDVFVSWLPLYHDMGLIGAWFGSLYIGARAALMSPLMFLARPERWLRVIQAERGTCSAAPNFAYDLCATKLDDESLQGLSLESWRAALNGAESVHAATIDRFCARFAAFGFRREAMMPVYGLAECSLGLTFPPPDRGPRVDRIKRGDFHTRSRAETAAADDPDALTFVSCGQVLPGHEARIVDDSGNEVGDRRTGRLQFRGPSATSGYYRNPEATAALLRNGWLESGDHAYMSGGEIYPVGRIRDLIIKGGRNIHPKDLEEIVWGIQGVRPGGVAVFGSPDPATGTERLVVMAETREEDAGEREAIVRAIRDASTAFLEGPPDDVVLVPPRTIPKTPSGKIQRFQCRELYEGGDPGAGGRSVAGQFLRLALSSIVPQMRRLVRRIGRGIYTAWAWAVFAAAGFWVWAGVMLLPSPKARRRAARAGCRLMLWATGLRPRVAGLDALPSNAPCLVAANHASYLDTVVMAAALPPTFGFVAKRELSDSKFFRSFYRRLGTRFVERFDPAAGSEELAGLEAAVRDGASLIIFPEGTITRAPGLRPFRMGAFMLSCRTGVPLTPVALVGTRSVLRDGTWAPRLGPMRVQIGTPIAPDGDDWAAAVRLRDRVRAELLSACGEVDLTGV